MEELLAVAPAGEGVVEPEVIGKKLEEGTEEVPAAKAGAKTPAAPPGEAKEEKKDEKKETKEVKGEKKK